jgi:beta-galactosidase
MPAPLSHRRSSKLATFHFGAAYYPEHWDAATRKDDARNMAKAGFNVVRLAEFAWDRMEPQEGKFDFSFFDKAIATLAKEGVQTLLCTPTAAPPRWLTLKHPEVLRIDVNLVPQQHGSRQHACTTHPLFRAYSQKITRAMAAHFKNNPHVVGWQTDNELHCHFSECHCASCQTEFAAFLQERYHGSIDKLNRAWGNAFWALTYTDFTHIQTPRNQKPTHANPAHQLDYYRFLSFAVTRFQHEQVELLRAANPVWFIFHNGLFGHIDYRGQFTKDLDLLGVDNYPFFDLDPVNRNRSQSFNFDRARAWSGNFIVPELQSGPGGQAPYFHDTPEPGEVRRMAYNAVARGADSVMFFRWRTCRFGAEEYWCGIIDHDNVLRRRYAEVKQLGAELKRLGPEVLGTSVHVDAAVATSDQIVNDSHSTYSFGLPGPTAMAETVHGWFFDNGFATGCVHPADDLTGLKLYILPHWAWFDPAWVKNLGKYVAAGGTLVVGARTATRTMENNITAATIPGVLRKLCGLVVDEYGRQNNPAARPLRITLKDTSVLSNLWYEVLKPDKGTQVLARWSGRHLTGKPAITARKFGKGRVVYVGTYLTKEACAALLPSLVSLSGLAPAWPGTPAGVQVVRRVSQEKTLWFFINMADRDAVIKKMPEGIDLVTNKKTAGACTLAPNSVAVIKTVAGTI